MTGWAAIAGTIFLIASGIAILVKKQMERNKQYEQASKDLKKAIADHDFAGILDAERRLRLYR